MLIWFIHVPRTGGMSFAKYLQTIKNKKINIRYDGHAKFSYPILNILKKKHKKIYTCTILRNPALHSMSLWSYFKKHKEHYEHSKVKNSNFINWCHKFKEFPYYTKFFGDGNLNKALKIINDIDFILHTESLNRDINKMLKTLNLKPDFNVHINSTSKRKPSEKEIEVIHKIRHDDYTLLKSL